MHYSIEFEVTTQPDDEFQFPQPRFKFMDKVAINNGCQPESWEVAQVFGMRLWFCRKEYGLFSEPCWEYNTTIPGHFPDNQWFEEKDLAPESEIARLQAEWDSEADSEVCPICNAAETEPETGCCVSCSHPF